jgi:hypothetical protein
MHVTHSRDKILELLSEDGSAKVPDLPHISGITTMLVLTASTVS